MQEILFRLATSCVYLQALWFHKDRNKIVQDFSTLSKDRFSKQNLIEFNGYTAKRFNSVMKYEIDDEDRFGLIFGTHGYISMVSVFYQLISMLVLSEGSDGKIVL